MTLPLPFRSKARSARLPRASRCGELRNSRNYATGIIAPLLSWLPARCLPSGARLRPLVNALATAYCRYHFFAAAAPISSFHLRLKDLYQKKNLILFRLSIEQRNNNSFLTHIHPLIGCGR